MSLFEIRLKALSGEELAQFLPGMLVSELFYAEVNLACTPHEDSREIRDYIDQLYLLGKRHGLNTFLIQKMVEAQVEAVKQHQ